MSADDCAEFRHVKLTETRDADAEPVGQHLRSIGRSQMMYGNVYGPVPG